MVLPALVACISLHSAGQAAGGEGPSINYDRFPPALGAESFRLDTGDAAVAARAGLSRFSQTPESPRSGADFALTPRRPDTAGPDMMPQPIPPGHATTAQFEGPYPALRAGFAEALLAATPDELAARQLDYAQFLIAGMLLPEARGVLRALPPDLAPPERDRAAGYRAIIARLEGGPPGDLPEAWAADPLWPVITGARAVDADGLRAAFGALAGQSRAVATAALPLLFDAALAAGETEIAAEILAAAPAGTDLDGTGLLDLLRGRLALAQGAADLAFDTFARVAEGQDRAAVEARIALADMALERKDPALLPEISRLLQDGLPRWRGDDAALRLRVRLARVAEDMGDIPTAVEAMAMILQQHPGTPEAALAEARIGVMTGLLAASIADPALSLAEALSRVRRLDAALAGRGDWLAARRALAKRLADAGLGQAARAEYAAIAKSPPAALQGADPAVLDALAVEEAALLLAMGDRAAARAVLDRRRHPQDPAQVAPMAALWLRANTTALLPDPLLAALKVDTAAQIADPAVQLALARVALTTGQTDAALAAYDRGLAHADQTARLTASQGAAEAGDAARAALYADGLTGDRAAPRQAVIENLAAPRRAGERLSVSGAAALITAAEEAGRAVDALLAGGGP